MRRIAQDAVRNIYINYTSSGWKANDQQHNNIMYNYGMQLFDGIRDAALWRGGFQNICEILNFQRSYLVLLLYLWYDAIYIHMIILTVFE